jgi:hypothetical protein
MSIASVGTARFPSSWSNSDSQGLQRRVGTPSIVALFSLVVAVMLFRLWYTSHVIMTHDAYVRLYGHRTTLQHLNDVFDVQRRTVWLAYVLTPVTIAVRIVFAAALLQLLLLAQAVSISLRSAVFATTVAFTAVVADGIARLHYLASLGSTGLTESSLSHQVGLLLPSFSGEALGLPWLRVFLSHLSLFDVAWAALVLGCTLWAVRGARLRIIVSAGALWACLSVCEWMFFRLLLAVSL